MKNKLIIFFTLMSLMLVFALPISAQATEYPEAEEIAEAEPPTINATITGTTLSIESTGGSYALEAVFVNERLFFFDVDDVLNIDLRYFAWGNEMLAVYAVDVAGDRSNIVWLDNPLVPPADPPEPPRQPIPLTPDGQATVLDHATDQDGKEFFTFITPAGNIFHLVVDHDRTSDNVYFLNAVTEADLIALAEEAGDGIGTESAIPVTPSPRPGDAESQDDSEDAEDTEAPPAQSGNSGTIIFVLIGVLAVGGAGYYFKIVKPKQSKSSDDDDYYEGEDDDTDEMVFEDEQPEDAEDVSEDEESDELDEYEEK